MGRQDKELIRRATWLTAVAYSDIISYVASVGPRFWNMR